MSVCLKINNAIEIVRFATTKEIFDIELSENKLIEFISHENYPCIGAIRYLNKLTALDLNRMSVQEEFRKKLIENKDKMAELGFIINEKELLNDKIAIITNAGCYLTVQAIMKYGKFKSVNPADESMAILLVIIVSSIYGKYGELENYELSDKNLLVLNQIGYNQMSNRTPNYDLLRAYKIYSKYLNEETIKDSFIEKFGYSIELYLVMLFIYFTMATNKTDYIDESLREIFLIKKEYDLFIKDNEFIFEYQKDINLSFETEQNLLIKKNILYTEKKYLIICPNEIVRKSYLIFIDKIFDSYSDKRKLSNIYGKAFEAYCHDLAVDYTVTSKNENYEVIKSFKYDKKESSDFYILQGKNLFVFEIKSTSRYNENVKVAINENSLISFEEEIKKKFYNPAKQIDDRLTEMKSSRSELNQIEKISGAKNVYYIVVSQEVITNNYIVYKKYLKNQIYKNTNKPVTYLNVLEFEYLMVSLKYREKTIARVLENFHKNYAASSFSDMVLKEHTNFHFNEYDVFSDTDINSLLDSVIMKDKFK